MSMARLKSQAPLPKLLDYWLRMNTYPIAFHATVHGFERVELPLKNEIK